MSFALVLPGFVLGNLVGLAADGDTVLVAPGTYLENLDFRGKAITVRSQAGNPVQCIIDCEGSHEDMHRGFHFHIELHPPLRKPNLLKYLAGPEIGGGNFLSDTSPEEKAEELRNLADIHYKESGN